MTKYSYIVRNSFREYNLSPISGIVSIVQPLILSAGYFFFYLYINRSASEFVPAETLMLYYIFIAVVSTFDFPRFGNQVQIEIQNEQYLMIDKLPMNPFVYTFLRSIGRNALAILFYMVISTVIFVLVNAPIISQIMLIPLAITGLILGHLIVFTIAIIVFYSEHIHLWMINILIELLAGKLIPLVLMPGAIAFTLIWLLPFAYAYGGLATHISQGNTRNIFLAILIAWMWIIILYQCAGVVWRKGSFYFQEHG